MGDPNFNNINESGKNLNSEQEEYLFYNVMPKEKVTGQVVGPTLTIKQPALDTNSQTNKSFFSKNKKWLFIAIAILVLAGAGYFVYAKFFSGPSDAELTALTDSFGNKAKKNISQNQNSFTTPQEWRDKYFVKNCQDAKQCGDEADPDSDGLTNTEEFKQETDPNNKDCDGDGISDGDEVHVFSTKPLSPHTNSDQKYTDADFLKGGYNPNKNNTKYTEQEIQDIQTKLATYSIHPPTDSTLKDALIKIYHFDQTAPKTPPPTNSTTTTPASTTATSSISTALAGADISAEAKLDRDTKRLGAIKSIGIALVKYQADHNSFPNTIIFSDMVSQVRPYIKVATNTIDPINKDPLVYAYATTGNDFTLSYYNETLNVLVKKHLQDAIKDKTAEESDLLDSQRKNDLDSLRTALLLYSGNNAGPNQDFVFPTQDKYKSDLLTNNYIGSIPKDPKNGQDYEYQVSDKFNTFTLKAKLDNPPTGTTGWLCNQDNCDFY